jgi:antitoxin (DNA-binding transcriptional repressor) of toxin-antitoxin stability system
MYAAHLLSYRVSTLKLKVHMLKAPVMQAGSINAAGTPPRTKVLPMKAISWALFIVLMLLMQYKASAQMTFTAGNLTQTENFDGMSGLALPSGFSITASSGLSTSVDLTASTLSVSSAGKTYKFISGTDNAVGILNSSGFSSPRSIFLQLYNNTGADITGLTVNFDYEKYRLGNRAMNFNFFGSPDNITYTAYTAGDQSYAADPTTGGSSPFPLSFISKTVNITGITIPQGGSYYLRWTLTGVGGSTNAQALAIDNVSIAAQQASAGCTAPSGLAANSITSTGAALSWNTVSGAAGYEYLVDQTASAPSGAGTATTSTSFSASGLTASTTYYLHVRTNCGSNNYSSWTTISFTTAAGCTPPSAVITPAGATTFCAGGSVVLNANTGTGLTYQWKLNGSNISNATNSSYTATAAGNYKVLVSNGSCADSSAATTVTVNALPTAVITPSGPTSFCNGGSVTLTGSSNNGLFYQWRLNGVDIGGASTNTYTATAAGNYKVVVTNAALCTDSSAATTITVNTTPTAAITPAGPTTFCAGNSVVLNANTGTGLTYQWRINGTNINGATAGSYTATTAGDYKVVVTNGTCTDSSAATTVTINAAPTATITPAGPTTFCNGGSTVLNANTGPGLTYQWRLNGANISGATASAYTASASGDYKVVVTNTSGCTDSSTAITITANVLAGINITPAGPTNFCSGSSVALNANTGAGLTYQWRVNGTNINGATNASYTANASGSYKVVVTNGTSCADSSTAVIVTVNALPTATITPAGATNFCTGGSVVLNANTGAGLTYLWRVNGTNINGATNASYTAVAAGSYKVVVTNASACSDSSTAITVTVNALPTATITPAGATTFCSGGSVVLNANTGAGLTYQWRMNGANINGATNASYTANTAGNYKVVIANGTSCTDSSTAVTVTVNALPTATITPAGATTFCSGGSVLLNANTGAGLTYQWRVNGTNINGATNASYTAAASGSYKVVVTNGTSCADSSTAVTVTVNALPVATITPAGATTFCSGGSVLLNANTGAGLAYQWRVNGANINGATNASYTAVAAGSYKVVVTNASACSDSSTAITVTVNALPIATITPAGATTFCSGGSVVLNANTGTGLTYQWRMNGANINGATNASYTANASGSYKVVITNGTSCTDSSTAVTVTVNALPVATITPAGPTTFCSGGSVVLNANTGASLTYQWRVNGTNINGATNASYTAVASGNYKVVITNGTSCTDSSTVVTVTVNALPVATIIPAGPTTFCSGGSVVLNANTGTGLTYQWRMNGANINGATNASYTANASGSYKVVITNGTSCTDSSTAITVTVNALPVATITPAGPTTFCSGGSLVLNANTGAGLTYQWRVNGTNINGATNASYTANAAGNYKVVITNGTSCTDSSTAVIVTVNALPVATITPAGPTTFCTGGNVVLNANGGAGLTYQWMRNSTNISGATNINYTANVSGTYKVLVTNSNGCSDSSAAIVVTVNPLPAAVITAMGNTTFCAYDSVLLDAGTAAGVTYQWQLNGGNIFGATNNSFYAAAPGIYTVIVANGNCVAVAPSISIATYQVMTPIITQNGDTLRTAAGYTGYQWYLNGQAVPGATSNVFTPAHSGQYVLIVTDTSGCTASSAINDFLHTAVPNVTIASAINMYPNPANDIVHIAAPVPISVVITTADGRTVLTRKDSNDIPVAALPQGIYFVRILDADGNLLTTRRLLKTAD